MENNKAQTNEIIVVTNYLTDGGAERVLSELISEWIKFDHKVLVIQIKSSSFLDSFVLPKEIEIININELESSRFVRRLYQAFQLVKILRLKKSGTVLSFTNPSILLVGMCSPFIKNKIVFSERNDPDRSPTKKRFRIVRDMVYRRADVCVFQTEDARAHFCKKVQSKGIIIPNPVNDDLPEPYNGERRKTIVAVCRLNQQKNIPMTIHAFNKLIVDYPDYTLEIYGRGELEKDLQDLINRLDLQEKVFLMGFSHQVYEKLRDAAVYVSSSNYEGISNSMLEALGMGVPTVCTDCPCGGARTYIVDGENGLLVPVGNVDALYYAIKKILDDMNFAKKLSINASKIREELPVKKIAEQWTDILI